MQFFRQILFAVLALSSLGYGEEKALVLVSIPTYQPLIQELLGDDFLVESVVPETANFHTYEPTIKKAIAYSKACLWCTIGTPFEERLEQFFRNQQHCPAIICLSIDGARCRHDEMDETDPHPWTSPREVQNELKMVLPQIMQLFPNKKDTIAANHKILNEKLTQLIAKIDALLQNARKKPMILAHAAFGYLCRDYGILQIPLESGGKEATATRLQQILSEGKEHHVSIVFSLKGFSKKGIEAVGKALNAQVIELDPYVYPYFESMEQIATAITLAVKDEVADQ